MTLRYSDISNQPQFVVSHTGLSPSEFEALAGKFAQQWEDYMYNFTWEGKARQRQSKGRKNNVLSTAEDKLLFLLYFLKLNPLQQVLAAAFGMDQPQASRWLEVLRPRLIATLEQERVVPVRKAERLYRLLRNEQQVLIDATERSVGRSIDDETQKEYYSGKKKPYH